MCKLSTWQQWQVFKHVYVNLSTRNDRFSLSLLMETVMIYGIKGIQVKTRD